MLLAIGPVFSVDFLIAYLSLGFIGIHVELAQSIEHCPWNLFVTNAGVLRYSMAAAFFLLTCGSFFHFSIIEFQGCSLE